MEDNIGVKTWRLIRKALPAPGKKLARWRGRAMLALHEDYRPADVLTALLQVRLNKIPAHLVSVSYLPVDQLDYAKAICSHQGCGMNKPKAMGEGSR